MMAVIGLNNGAAPKHRPEAAFAWRAKQETRGSAESCLLRQAGPWVPVEMYGVKQDVLHNHINRSVYF